MRSMAPVVCILFLFAFAVERAQPTLSEIAKKKPVPSRNIALGSFISATRDPTSWASPSGHFAFGFYKEGNGFRVGIWISDGTPSKTVVWTANRNGKPVSANATLGLTRDGKFLLTIEDSPRNFLSSNHLISFASMFDNGNFILYDEYTEVLWQSFNHPTDTILPGQGLMGLTYDALYSSVSRINHSTGRFKLSSDLALIPNVNFRTDDSDKYWSSHEGDLVLDDNGYMYMVNDTGEILENITYGFPSSNETMFIYRATLDYDGIFRLYSHSIRKNSSSTVEIRWQYPHDPCSVNGICGINSYCKLAGNQTDCLCLPGFDYIDSSDRSAGCKILWVDHCFGITEEKKMITLENTTFKVDSYFLVKDTVKEACEDACQRDSNCMAALFAYGSRCYKLEFPLNYGVNDISTISDVLFIKLASCRDLVGENNTITTISKTSITILVVGAILTICSCITMAVFGYLFSRRGLWRHTAPLQGEFDTTQDIVLRSFSYNELAVATNDFNQVLGRGSFGTVYKGALPNNERPVAVKRLEKVVEEGEREFQMEMRAIGRTHHRNLVRLIGFCNEGFNRLLVYEYMRNGSLADFLFREKGHPPWSDRVKTILEVARGILYLHEDCEPHIIHCDIKPQNILMDEFWTAKISDFGLAKLLTPNQTRTFTGPRGTRGYLAPEWYQNKSISVKADVYSFGIVLLEIVCCRRNIELEVEDDEIILTEWIYKCYQAGELIKLFDDEEVEKKQLERIVMVGLWCIQREPALRPSMRNVILMLEGIVDVQVPPSPGS